MKTKFKDLLEASNRANVSSFSSMIDVIDFAHGHVSAPIAVEFLTDDALRCTFEVSDLQINYNLLAAEGSSVTSECGT